jgi:hypothetical protein
MKALITMAGDQKPSSFVEAVEELKEILVCEPTAPHCAINGFFQLFESLGKCLFVKPELSSADAGDANRMLQPSDLFLQYLAAVRARDWPQVAIVEHELRS